MADELIHSAFKTGAAEDYQTLLQALRGQEVFVRLRTAADGIDTVPLVTVDPAKKAVRFFSSRNDPHLGDRFGGTPWEAALEMVAHTPEADGLILQNAAGSWVAINRNGIAELLNALP